MYRPYSSAATSELFQEDEVGRWIDPTSAQRFEHQIEFDEAQNSSRYQPLSSSSEFAEEPNFLLEEVARSLKSQRDSLLDLLEDWDGYGGLPISAKLLTRLISDLHFALADRVSVSPDLIPGGDGSVQAEWRLTNFQATFRREVSGDRYFWIANRTDGREWEFFGDSALSALQKWSAMLK